MAIYFLKINAALMLLYGFYRLTVSRDTFFSLRRMTLWLIYAASLLVPVLNLEYWVRETPTMMGMANVYADTIYPMVVVRAQAPSITWMDVVMGIYWVGVAWLSLRMLWQLASICRLAFVAKKQEVEGITVHVLQGEGSPFSFFRWIFVYPQTLEGGQLHEVLVHECTHARGLHSVDSIFSELFTVLCWFNPFAWLMKQEVRINLEYLADESVLSDGNARKSYQYHLLGLAYRKPMQSSTEIANNFNLLPLKKRIKMMNKRRTSEIGKAKYLLFAPLAGALLMVSNIESVAREIGEQVPEVATLQEKAEQVLNSDVAVANPKANETIELLDAEEALESNQVDEAVVDSAKQGDKVFDVVEEMPQFPGGQGEMMKWLSMNVKYPKTAHDAHKQGRVIVSFIIGKDGSVSGAKVARGADADLDAEALRVVNSMPKWTPGKLKGKAVDVRYTVPIVFSLKSDDKKVDSEKFFKEQAATADKFIESAYPGGAKAFSMFFAENVRYPMKAQKAGLDKFRTHVMFIVNTDGSVTFPVNLSMDKVPSSKIITNSITVVGYKYLADQSVATKEAEELINQEVQKLVRKMPKWNKVDQQTLVAIPFTFVVQ